MSTYIIDNYQDVQVQNDSIKENIRYVSENKDKKLARINSSYIVTINNKQKRSKMLGLTSSDN